MAAPMIKQIINRILLLVYPVGSIYMSVNNIDPQTLFGGTWVSWGSGKVPVGVDISQTEFNSVEKTGGEKTHKLTRDELAKHSHSVSISNATVIGTENQSYGIQWRHSVGYDTKTMGEVKGSSYGNGIEVSGGEDTPHNNLQPYITCYMWKRVA